MRDLFLFNIGLLASPQGNGPAHGPQMGALMLRRNAAVWVQDGLIVGIYEGGEMPLEMPPDTDIVDAGGRLVTPGLIDAHTHLVFGGYRQQEAASRVRGVEYMDILKAGGGILDTVRNTRAASAEDLYAKAEGFVREMLLRGVTACEAKSGYGLDLETEAKQMRIARMLGENTPMEVASTYLGAHAVPPEYAGKPDAYVDFLVQEGIPAAAAEGLADFCDVFCEEGVFDIAQSRRILACAKAHGLGIKLHADELMPMGGGSLAAEIGAVSADHLIAASDESIAALAQSDTVAVLLPQTSLYLGKPFARGREMVDAGAAVAVATDFNPGSCPSNSLPLAMNLAFLKCRLTPQEVLTAVTLNAACALNRGDTLGSIEPGKQGDLVLWDADDLEMLTYRMGSNLALSVFKKGERI